MYLRGKKRIVFIIQLTIIILWGILHIYSVWLTNIHKAEEESKILACTIIAVFQKENLNLLELTEEDLKKLEYKQVKESLMHLVEINQDIRFAYIYTERDGKIYFMADSEPEVSEDYSPPGQEYTEADDLIHQAMLSDNPIVTPPSKDRWGTWVSVLVPIKEETTGNIIAVFGIDYPARDWLLNPIQKTISTGIIMLFVFMLFFTVYIIAAKNKILREEKKRLARLNNMLTDQEELFRAIYEQSPLGITFGSALHHIIDANPMFEKIVGWPKDQIAKMNWPSITHPEDLQNDLEHFDTFIKGESNGYSIEKRYIKPDQTSVWVNMTIAPIHLQHADNISHVCIVEDISERKSREEEINYLYKRDTLTGLYNRRYFDVEKQNLDVESSYPLTVVIGDINGLKFINDSFGHLEGDKIIKAIAEILQSCCRDEDIPARTGGDEFSILMPNTSSEEAEEFMNRVYAACEDYQKNNEEEAYHTSISIGFATKTQPDEILTNIIKDAEDSMYRHKMLQNRSLHSSIISSMKSTLFEKSQETEEHAQRLIELSYMMGRKMKLNDKQLNELELLSTLHDIGKIGITDTILNKPDKLSDEEWIMMKKHPEIGYRIAMSTPELSPIAIYILCHHERWDGTGYPQGLKGEDIPLLSRIIAIADSYDAMTSDRPYRKALSKEAALEEIKKNTGTQFDPEITKLFIKQVSENKFEDIQ